MSAVSAAPVHLRQRLIALGAKKPHVDLALRAWLAGKPLLRVLDSRHCSFAPAVVELLPEIERELDAFVHITSEHAGSDGSARRVCKLADGAMIESVLLVREAVCVSTQVGCAVGCRFCMTGRDGLVRNLTADEILAQVALARRSRRMRRVVFMGMGEPSHNIANVLVAIDVLGEQGDFGHKELVFSTVGDKKLFDRLLARTIKPAVALSLHTTRDELRADLLPRAPRVGVVELVELAEDYARRSGHPIQVQWTLLQGVNDGDDELERLAELFRGKKAIVNFIPFNPVEGAGFDRPSDGRALAMAKYLRARSIVSTVRVSAGQDVDGACGQLRARVANA